MLEDLLLMLAGGVGAFLLGMNLMEDGLELMAKASLQRFFARVEQTKVGSVLFGIGATLLLQSSTAVSLMTLSIVQAGLLRLGGALAVVLGANLGTTGTSWLVATLGFQTNLYAVALPIAGLGGLILAFFGHRRGMRGFGYLVAGFGLIFVGLAYLRSGMSDVEGLYTLLNLDGRSGILAFFGIGLLLTVLVQSSSVAIAMALSALHTELITFPMACALVVGSNVGTTVTVILGAVGGHRAKKQVATAHLIYNLVTGLAMLPFVSAVAGFLPDLMGTTDTPTLSLAWFQTFFNLIIVLLFFPFLGAMARWLNRLYPDPHADYMPVDNTHTD